MTSGFPLPGSGFAGRFRSDKEQVVMRSGVSGGQPYFALAAEGNFGGGTLKTQAGFTMADGLLHWFDIPTVSLTAPGYIVFAGAADVFKVVLSGSTTPDVFWTLK